MDSPGRHLRQVSLPALTKDGEAPVFAVQAVSPIGIALRGRRSPADLAPLFGSADVISSRLGRVTWYLGRSPEWSRYVMGSRSLWADVDILNLGLGNHPIYYAMGGLPGAPPNRHRVARRMAVVSSPHRGVDDATLRKSMVQATDLAVDRATSTLDVQLFARALFLITSTAIFAELDVDAPTILKILGWFDQWSKIVSSPVTVIGAPWLPFGPASRLRKVLAPWYAFLASLLEVTGSSTNLAGALARQASNGEITTHEAVGYLATVLFAGTEPPAHTLLWAHSHCVAADPHDLGDIDEQRAEALLWESFRVQPAVNAVVRRLSACGDAYRSSSSNVYVVAPPLTHQRSNERNARPVAFTPSAAGPTRFDPDEYPGLGTGVHHCIGALMGMAVARHALAFLLQETKVARLPDLAPAGIVTSSPRRLPIVEL